MTEQKPLGKWILVVEDDESLQEAIVEILQDNGYEAITAANGQEALDRLQESQSKPCVILLDLMMPVMDGWEFNSIKRLNPEMANIPVIVLTAHGSVGGAVRNTGAVSGLRKPVTVDSLLRVIEPFYLRRQI